MVENRKLNASGSNTITVDGHIWSPTEDAEKRTALETYHVEGNVEGSRMGVYLPAGQSIELMWDQRDGNWATWYPVNSNNMDDTQVSGYTLLTKIPHQSGPEKVDNYAYTLLPMFTVEQTQAYADAPDTLVLA